MQGIFFFNYNATVNVCFNILIVIVSSLLYVRESRLEWKSELFAWYIDFSCVENVRLFCCIFQ